MTMSEASGSKHMRLRLFRDTHDVQAADVVALARFIFVLFLVSSRCVSSCHRGWCCRSSGSV